jgi:hypothetical protein
LATLGLSGAALPLRNWRVSCDTEVRRREAHCAGSGMVEAMPRL